jgi:hypothetical protein
MGLTIEGFTPLLKLQYPEDLGAVPLNGIQIYLKKDAEFTDSMMAVWDWITTIPQPYYQHFPDIISNGQSLYQNKVFKNFKFVFFLYVNIKGVDIICSLYNIYF